MKTETTDAARSLVELIAGFGSCAVAYSGGVDSAVVAKAAQLALGHRAVAVTGRSASLASGELEAATRLASLIGIRHLVVDTDELAQPQYTANGPDRCFHCKTELYTRLESLAGELRHGNVIANGAQHRRPGRLPARNAGGGRTSRAQSAGRMRAGQGRRATTCLGVGAAGVGQAGHALPEQPRGLWRRGDARSGSK